MLIKVLIQFKDSSNISTSVAIVGRGPHCYETITGLLALVTLLGEHGLVTFHDKLVGASDEVDVIYLVELGHNVTTKEVAGTAGGKAPPFDILGVRPHEIAHGAVVRHFLFAVNDADLSTKWMQRHRIMTLETDR